MIIFKRVEAISSFLKKQNPTNTQIGFVPTMGALHLGHISLIKESTRQNEVSICSIFVNPTQFNDKSDFEKYPIKIENDIALLYQAGCDVLFLPSADEIYPNMNSLVHYYLGNIETLLEGKYRPGHFQGVCQVVHRLLAIINPKQLFLGQKDYQQCMVIKRLIEIASLDVELVICPTQREATGLALSSRNMRLHESAKQSATIIYNSLLKIKESVSSTIICLIIKQVQETLLANGFDSVDYVAICDATTMESITEYDPSRKTIALIAAFIDGVRLIDNIAIN